MLNVHVVLYALAFAFFLVAAYPPSQPGMRWEMLAFACLTLTLLV
jgi:hypothetical protein